MSEVKYITPNLILYGVLAVIELISVVTIFKHYIAPILNNNLILGVSITFIFVNNVRFKYYTKFFIKLHLYLMKLNEEKIDE